MRETAVRVRHPGVKDGLMLALAMCLAVSGCVRPTDATRERALAASLRGRQLADGVSASDSVQFGVPQDSLIPLAGGGGSLLASSRSAAARASVLEVAARCGVDSTTLPRGVRLLPTFFEFTFRLSQYGTPVRDAKAASPPQPVCGPTMVVSPNPGNLATSDYPTRVQREPLDVRFDTAVTGVSIYGLGALKCYTGQYGRLTAYDAADQVLISVDLQMRNVSDCGQDSITFGAYGTVSGMSSPIRRVRIEPPQPWHWDVFLAGEFCCVGYVTANYMMSLSTGASAPTIAIVSAGGPNPGRSFIVKAPENVIRLEARVTPASLTSTVDWEVVPLNDFTIPPSAVTPGAVTSFVVPDGNRSRSRWPVLGRVHHDPLTAAQKASDLTKKSLGYRITATVTANGQTVRSVPVTVQQDEIDTMREEYVEFRQQRVLERTEFGTFGDSLRNRTGDYTLWPSGPRLVEKMPIMQQLAVRRFGRPITVMSGYRNPVHHYLHALASAPESQHLYGNATDWVITEPSARPSSLSKEQWFTELWKLTIHASVNGCWEPAAEIIRTSNRNQALQSLNHAHSDWREMTSCVPAWRLR